MTAPGPEHLRGYRMRDYDDLIARLARARESRRVTIRALAAHAGCSGYTITNGLSGRHRMDPHVLFACWDLLGVDLALIPREDTP